MNRVKLTLLLGAIDLLFSSLAWGTFYYFRKIWIEKEEFTINDKFYLGMAFISLLWLLIYTVQGTYVDVRRLYRMRILNLTFVGTLIGVLIIFFLFLIDDDISGYKQYYTSLMLLFAVQFSFVFVPRAVLVSWIVKRIHRRDYGFNTLIIGGSDKAVAIYDEIMGLKKGNGNRIVGFMNLNGIDKQLESRIPYFGHFDSFEGIVEKEGIEEVIVALESSEHDRLKRILSKLERYDLNVKILPDMYDILSGTVSMSNLFGALLIDVNPDPMPVWQKTLKRSIDVVVSAVALLLLIPLFLVLAILVKFSSPGPIFFLQDRIGKNGKTFRIIKFRTMFVDAEKCGPQLSSSNDPRITGIGRFMRKTRLDEFPQFINVLKGEMSLVGPRPERQFYIDQITVLEPQYLELTKVRPGITSWGQVKYGYAENVEQMLDRMKFDLLYLKNRSISLDFKIMLYTILIVLRGSGK
jgi:exopolysaccharide biosynthesis polyprenyl glycosylphosphotransferase